MPYRTVTGSEILSSLEDPENLGKAAGLEQWDLHVEIQYTEPLHDSMSTFILFSPLF